MIPGIELIGGERLRQQMKGYDAAHDDGHTDQSLAIAAACYALPMDLRKASSMGLICPALWPWRPDEWRPDDRVAELVKGGALIAAEIDRWQRIAPPSHTPSPNKATNPLCKKLQQMAAWIEMERLGVNGPVLLRAAEVIQDALDALNICILVLPQIAECEAGEENGNCIQNRAATALEAATNAIARATTK